MNTKQKKWILWFIVAFGILLVVSLALLALRQRSKMKMGVKYNVQQSAPTDFLQVGGVRNKCYDCEERGDVYGYKSKCFDCVQATPSASPTDTASINYLQETPGLMPKLGYV